MKKVLKISQSLCICAALLLGSPNNAEAFIPIPPMPWSLEVDLPGNIGKAFSQVQSLALQYKTIKSQLNTLSLKSISGSLLGSLKKNFRNDENKPKNPGKGIAKGYIDGISLSETTDDEKSYFDAYNKLFLLSPSTESYTGEEQFGKEGYQIVDVAYKNKATEYRQDVIVDTYFTGLMTERYLMLVEKTLKRLEECQNSIDTNKCVFFGLQMVEIPSEDNPQDLQQEDENKPNPGVLAQMKNTYIVSTVYDRLMRIVEDLTATEALYRAAKQMQLAEPIKLNESSAEKYIPQIYNFASRDIEEKIYAKSLLSRKKQSECFDSGGKGCPGYNKESADLKNMNDAAIMQTINEIEEELNTAAEWHNMKKEMPKYKTKYRQYLIAKEIHDNALKALKDSENCAKTFLTEYSIEEPDFVWGTTKNSNDHENREVGSLSRWLINQYEQRTMNKIIGSDKDCDGYYENCPMGYKPDMEKHCEVLNENGEIIREDKNLHPCIVETVVEDNDKEACKQGEMNDCLENTQKKAENFDPKGENGDNYLKDATGEEAIDLGSRIALETPWQIGAEMLMDLVDNKKLQFRAWNDQKSFQEEYLRQKYRNIGIIIKSMDTAVNAYQIAAANANDKNLDAENRDKQTNDQLTEMINSIAFCMPMSEAIEEAKKEFCIGDETEIMCNVVADNSTGKITGTREVKSVNYKGEVVTNTYTKEWNQIVSLNNNSCAFKNEEYESKDLEIKDNNTNSCESADWDLSVGYLVRSYYNQYLGNCAPTSKENAQAMYNKANANGRIVAQDKLFDANQNGVINIRIAEDNAMKEFIRNHEIKINQLKTRITQNQASINKYNDDIDKATRRKNMAQKAKTLAEQRIKNIDAEIDMLRARQRKTENNEKSKSCATDYQIMKLNYEKNQIKQDKPQWKCPDSCKDLATKNLICSNTAENYLISLRTFEEQGENSNLDKYVLIDEAKKAISQQQKLIKDEEAKKGLLQEEIKETKAKIEDLNEEFADEYVEKAEQSQEAIEEANEEFESFMEEVNGRQKKRMENSQKNGRCRKHKLFGGCKSYYNREYERDDLTTTITQVFADSDNLQETVKAQINQEIIGDISQIESVLQNNFGIPSQFVLDETFSKFGMATGTFTALEIIEKIKDEIVDVAAGIIAHQITNADEIIAKAQESALQRVEKRRRDLGVCENCPQPNPMLSLLSEQRYHEETVISEHKRLITELNRLSNSTIVPNIFGIPENAEETDVDYFVALPARGINYKGKAEYETALGSADENAGRDYLVPKEPFIHLPPVREVFYYSAQDYDDTPKSKKKNKPVISYLLNKKYPGTKDPYAEQWENLPEIWRYLLARPNLRADRKYQQTFGERSLEKDRLNEILEGSDSDYNTIIARGGTYPCRIGNRIYDAVGNKDSVKNIEFVYRSDSPFTSKYMQQCRDIRLYSEKPCNKYGTRKNSICHLLSNHGPKETNKKSNYKDWQEMKNTRNLSMFADHSELGLLLGKELKYRPMQRNINEYLISEDKNNTENNINRQKAEHAAFTHNVFGSFLETVNAEYNARKSLEKIEEETKTIFVEICKMIHDQKDAAGKPITIGKEDSIPDSCNNECMKEHNEKCAEIMFENFAKSAEDKIYGTANEYKNAIYNGITCRPEKGKLVQASLYDEIFCMMNDKKDEKLEKAIGYFNKLKEYSVEDRNRVYEYLISIMKEIAALKVDENEVTLITPDVDVDIQNTNMSNLDKVNNVIYQKVKDELMDKEIKKAKADREVERENDDLAISSMENQSQIVPYCPFFIYSENNGL